MSLLREGTAQFGERIDLSQFGGADLWLEVTVQPTWRGRLLQFFFKPSCISLELWPDTPASDGDIFQAPASMLAAGFVVSPLVMKNEDLVDAYTGEGIRHAAACSIQVKKETAHYWHQEINYKVFGIETKLGRCVSPDMARLKKQLLKTQLRNSSSPR
jgi:hypothetical protein